MVTIKGSIAWTVAARCCGPVHVRLLPASVLAALLALAPAHFCHADDGAIESVGGAVSPMTEHPTIRLTAEYVHAWFRRTGIEVECVFFLENDGPATSVTMGFPNFSEGADVERNAPFHSFASYVDGDSVGVTILPDAEHNSYGDYGCWYTKEVSFAAGQRRCIRDVYSGSIGNAVPDYQWFDYILWSGGSWAGTIGLADMVATFDSLAVPIESLGVKPPASHISRNEIRWHFVDLEPTRLSDAGTIHLSWRGRLQR